MPFCSGLWRPGGNDTCGVMPWWEGGKRNPDSCATRKPLLSICRCSWEGVQKPAGADAGCTGDRGRDLSPLCCLHLCSALKTQCLNSRSKAGSRPGFSLGSLEGGLPAALCSGLLVSWGVHDSSQARLAWGMSVLTAQDSSVTAAARSGPWAGRLEGLVFSSLFVSFPALPLNFMSYDIP